MQPNTEYKPLANVSKVKRSACCGVLLLLVIAILLLVIGRQGENVQERDRERIARTMPSPVHADADDFNRDAETARSPHIETLRGCSGLPRMKFGRTHVTLCARLPAQWVLYPRVLCSIITLCATQYRIQNTKYKKKNTESSVQHTRPLASAHLRSRCFRPRGRSPATAPARGRRRARRRWRAGRGFKLLTILPPKCCAELALVTKTFVMSR